MRIPSASDLAAWPMPNYVDPVSRGPGGKIVGVVLTAFVTILLAIRLYTRTRIVRSFGLDDILIIAAFCPSLAFTVCGIYAEFNFKWGLHLWDVPFNTIMASSQFSLATFCLFDLSSNLVKLSSLAMLYRLVSVTKSRMNIAVPLIAAGIGLSSLLFIFITIFQCNPVSAYWTLSAKPQNCIDETSHLLAAGSINTITDFVVVLLPIKTVARLQLPRKQYTILLVLFGTGFCACAAGCVRIYYTWVFTTNYDRTWNGWTVWVSSSIELYLGIICASVPACKQFFTKYLPDVIETSRRSGIKSTGSESAAGGPDRKSTRLSVTIDTMVETSYQNRASCHNRASMNPVQEPRASAANDDTTTNNTRTTAATGGDEVHDIEEPIIAEPRRARTRPQTWPFPLPASSSEHSLSRVSTKRSSEQGGLTAPPRITV